MSVINTLTNTYEMGGGQFFHHIFSLQSLPTLLLLVDSCLIILLLVIACYCTTILKESCLF